MWKNTFLCGKHHSFFFFFCLFCYKIPGYTFSYLWLHSIQMNCYLYWLCCLLSGTSRVKEPAFHVTVIIVAILTFYMCHFGQEMLSEIDGQELSLNLHSDSKLASFEDSSGKYNESIVTSTWYSLFQLLHVDL